MVATIVTNSGRVSIPDEVLEALGLQDGDVVAVEQVNDGVLLRRSLSVVKRTAGSLAEYAIYPIPTDDEMDEAIGRAIAEDFLNEDYGPR